MDLKIFPGNSNLNFPLLAERMPSALRYETEENHKNAYQEIQQIFSIYGEAAGKLHPIKEQGTLCLYLTTLSTCIPLVDEEVFDHRMNLVQQYRELLRHVLPSLPEYSHENQKKLSRSIADAIQSKTLLKEKYQKFTEVK